MIKGNPSGLTMVEIIVVLIIGGIMLVMGVASRTNFVEKSRGKNAETNLAVIYNAEKRYRLSNSVYFPSTDGESKAEGDIKVINKELNILIDDFYFTYSITGDKDTFNAVATRNQKAGGPCTGRTVTIFENNSTPEKDCLVWR